MKPPSRRRKRAGRLRVSRLERLPKTSFGKLVTRALGGGPALGGVSILHESLPPRTELPTVTHRRTTEWVYCTAGKMTAVLGGRRYALREGAVVLIPPGTPHKFRTGAGTCCAISIFHPALKVGKGADIQTGP
ncbi:cupin domain-containing protein [bacterium]|nr:MAG: cupin domain-containing protein [bacterium]